MNRPGWSSSLSQRHGKTSMHKDRFRDVFLDVSAMRLERCVAFRRGSSTWKNWI